MKSYEEFKEDVVAEGVDAKDRLAWTNFTRAAEELRNTLNGQHSLHALILNDIDHRMQDVKEVLDRLDVTMRWRDQIRSRGGQVTKN